MPIEKSCLRRSLDYGRADRNYSDEPPQIIVQAFDPCCLEEGVWSIAIAMGQQSRGGCGTGTAASWGRHELDPNSVRRVCEALDLKWSDLPGPKCRA